MVTFFLFFFLRCELVFEGWELASLLFYPCIDDLRLRERMKRERDFFSKKK